MLAFKLRINFKLRQFILISKFLINFSLFFFKKNILFFFKKNNVCLFFLFQESFLFLNYSFFFFLRFFVFSKKKCSFFINTPFFKKNDDKSSALDFSKIIKKKKNSFKKIRNLKKYIFLKKHVFLFDTKTFKFSKKKNLKFKRFFLGLKNFLFCKIFYSFKNFCSKRLNKFSTNNYIYLFLKKKKRNVFFLKKSLKFFFLFLFKKKKKNFLSLKKQNFLSLSPKDRKLNQFFKNYLILFCFFFKIKNFFFFSNFNNFFNFLPIDFFLKYFFFKENINLKKNVTSSMPGFPWVFFIIENLLIIKKKMYSLLFFYNFLNSYIESLLGSRVCIWFKNFSFKLKKLDKLANWLTFRVSLKFKKFNRLFFFKEFLDVLMLSFLRKDVKFFEVWLVRFLEKIHYKHHKNFLFLLNKFLLEFFKFFKVIFLVKGFKLDVRGKLSAGGNSKKRHYLIKLGSVGFSKKKNKISFSQNIVPTVTGVLGTELVIVY